jgi:hypothetical protein
VRKNNISPYTLVGLILTLIGFVLTGESYFNSYNSQFIAIGIATLVLGFTTMLLPNDPTPPKNLHTMLNESLYNVEAILEQFEVKEKAIYLPRRERKTYAYIPLGEPVDANLISKLKDAPPRLITDIDRKLGLMILIPIGGDLLESIKDDADIEKTLRYILIKSLGLVQSVKEIKQSEDIIIQMKGSTLNIDFPHYISVLGTLQTSIVGSVLANIYHAPISLMEENTTEKTIIAIFRVIKNE